MSFHETIAPDEATRFEQYAGELAALQDRRARRTGKVSRALHVKQHIGAVGELITAAPETSRVGVFATPGRRIPVYARFSSGTSARRPDNAPDIRGFALKLVGVSGQKIIAGLEQEVTQDFLFINQPAIAFRDPEEFMIFVRAAMDGPAKLLPRLFAGFGLRRGLQVLGRVVRTPKLRSFVASAFHTASPIAFGAASAAKLALFPLPASPLPSPPVPAASGPDALRADLVARLKAGPLAWSVRAQFFVDDDSTPIEDTSVAWSGPWVDLGTLTLPRQDPESPTGREIGDLVENLSFDPWHSIADHRPLGAMMRARAVAYRRSVIARQAAPEPKSVPEL
jgi:hypothetical protein